MQFTDLIFIRPPAEPLELAFHQLVITVKKPNQVETVVETAPDPKSPDLPGKVTLTTEFLIDELNGNSLIRADVLRSMVQSDEVGLNVEKVNAFVASQYYGYLRRTPDPEGFNAWVNYLNTHPGDFRTMVHGFMNSIEYRLRFGPQ